MVRHTIFLFIFMAFSNASDTKKLAIINFSSQGFQIDSSQSVPDKIQAELQKIGNYEFLEEQKLQSVLTEKKINIKECSDTCLTRLGKLLGVDQIVNGNIIMQDNLFTISSKLFDVDLVTTVEEINFETNDKNELFQFGIHYIAAGLAKKQLPKRNGSSKMYTVSLEAISVNDADFFRSSFGEPYPIYIILTEDGSVIWETHVGHLRGYRTLKESFVLALNTKSKYELQIYDPGFQQETMYYRIASPEGAWPFQKKKHHLGKFSFIELSQISKPNVAYKPNKILYR